MKKILIILVCFITVNAFAQNDSKDKKVWLGVLTLPEKYKDEKNWTKDDQVIIGGHFQRLMKKKEEGIVVLAGRTELPLDNSDMMRFVVFYAKDENEARQFINDDPCVKAKIMLAKVHPYGLAISKCQ